MLLTLTTTHRPATDLGYLLHKNPARPQVFKLPFGQAHVFYPEVSEARCTAALLLDVDPVGLVRGPGAMLSDYVNDRPYASSSFLCVAMARVLREALAGRSRERPELAKTPIPLTATVAAVPCRGGDGLIERLFEPLEYEIATDRGGVAADPCRHRNLTLRATRTLGDVLTHLYVLLPVLDNRKHYWIGEDELRKLLDRGKGWLETHPAQQTIVRRYLGHRKALATDAAARLRPPDADDADPEDGEADSFEEAGPLRSLHEQRLDWVVEALTASGAARVVDVGCGEGRLLHRLLAAPRFTEIVGAESSPAALEYAERRLKLRRLTVADRERITLVQTGLTYRDARLEGYDAAAVVEVVEHVDPDRLAAFEQVLFGAMKPRTIALTTPNREYNATFESARPNGLRHRDHRFEWTRGEFAAWAENAAAAYGYTVETGGIGPAHPDFGPPTQRGLFRRCR